jgi:hypothetical protein
VTRAPFVPVPGQSFANKREWIARAQYVLTAHPEYRNTEHDGAVKGWRGHHFTALCFDQKGRRVRQGSDFQHAEDDDAFPVWWVWPDQIAGLLLQMANEELPPSTVDACGRADGAPWDTERT